MSSPSATRNLIKNLGLYKPARLLYNKIFFSQARRLVELRGVSCIFKTPTGTIAEYVDTFSGERNVLDHFLGNLNDQDVVWDVGANYGMYTIFAAKIAKNVVAFEPEPESLKLLSQNISLNGISNVSIHPIALGSENSETMIFQADTPNTGSHALVQREDYRLKKKGVRVQLTRGDDVVSQREAQAPNILKIDVEGAEMRVLDGMNTILEDKALRAIYCEVHPRLLPLFADSVESVEKTITRAGFSIVERQSRGSEHHLVCLRHE